MKKGFIIFNSLLLIILLCTESMAYDSKGKWSFGLNVGYYFPEFSDSYTYSEINIKGIEVDMDAENNISYGVNFNYRMTEHIFFQVMIEKYKGDLSFDYKGYDSVEQKNIHFDVNDYTDLESNLSILPLSLDFGCSFLQSKVADMDFDLYALFGSTFFFGTNHIYRPKEFYNYNIKYPDENDSAIGLNVGVGMDFFFTKRLAANLDLRYYWGEADFNTGTDFELGGFRGTVGLKIVLGTLE